MPTKMAEEIDRVSDIFRVKTIFISGATGFIGKVLIEKLLRVTEVKRLYLLIRRKKGKTPKDRLTEIFNHVLFSKLNELKPDAIKKCFLVTGDVIQDNLGISADDRKLITEEVDYIVHSAATTRFDDTVRYAILMNTRGTKFMLDLAKECQKLKCFVHISTAYAFPNEDILYEKTYDPPADPNAVLNSINWLQDEVLSAVTKDLLKDIPNTYTLSKSLAEGLVNEQMGKLPVCIMRPAVVIPSFKEPFPGFFNNLQSPMGIFVGAGKGVIRSMYMDSASYANLIPVDSTVNVIMVGMWDYVTTGKKHVFNICVPEEDIRVSWEEVIELGKEVVSTKVPFNGIMWYPGGTMTKSKVWHNINVILFQLIPAIFIDILLFCLAYKPVLFEVNKRLHKGQEMFEYYTTKAWHFNVEYMLSLRRRLNSKEKETYPIEAEGVDLKEYLANSILYARRHVLKETDDMLPAARRNMKIMFVFDRIVKITFFSLVIYYLYKFLFA